MIINPKKKGNVVLSIFLILFALLLAFVGIMTLLEIGEPDENPIAVAFAGVVCLACAAFFGWGACCFLRQNRENKPLIEITDTYFYDNSSAVAFGKIAWSDMERVYLKGSYLCIKLRDPDVYMARKGVIARLFIRGNRRLGYGDACVCPAQRFPREESAFFEAFFKHRLPDNVK